MLKPVSGELAIIIVVFTSVLDSVRAGTDQTFSPKYRYSNPISTILCIVAF
jgi:hypothetical protein